MRTAFLCAQWAFLLALSTVFCAFTSPWLLAGGGAVSVRALALLTLLDGHAWVFSPALALLVAGLSLLLYALAWPGLRILRPVGMALTCAFLLQAWLAPAPIWLVPYLCTYLGLVLGCLALPDRRPLHLAPRLCACACGVLYGTLWLLTAGAGVQAWLAPWQDAMLLLPFSLALLPLFYRNGKACCRLIHGARPRALRGSLVFTALLTPLLMLTLPPLGFACGLGGLPLLLAARPGKMTSRNGA